MRLTAVTFLAVALFAPSLDLTRAPDRIATNDNQVSAGSLKAGVLTVRLEARTGEWHPDDDTEPGILVSAFGETGKPLQIPGPMIRITEGTDVVVSVHNTLDSTLVVNGLNPRGPASNGTGDTIQVAPGATREVRFSAGTPGTYYYWASSVRPGLPQPPTVRGQLAGAMVIDPRGRGARRSDRIFVLGFWSDSIIGAVDLASTRPSRLTINGKAWPNTERLTYQTGDSIDWRVINASSLVHPMHLHGFYYRVNSRGSEQADSVYPLAAPPHMVVTERLAAGRTMSLTWVPERPGNWLFHCHDNVHIRRNLALPGAPAKPVAHDHNVNHALEMMGGLVTGVHVVSRGTAAERPEPAARHRLRLVARVDTGGTATEPSFGFALQDPASPRAAAAPLLPGPTIVLKRAEPVSIMVVNELPEATAIHWHGIELESYFDGVAGFAGRPGRIAPAIEPRDSFEVRFTPPRAGTFIYHTHIDEIRQQQAGLSGALLVVDPATAYDPDTNILLLISTPRKAADADVVLLNGTATPPARELRVGTRYRVRIINIHTFRPNMLLELKQESAALTWRALAKDGADVPAERATVRPAVQQLGNGETYDFEFTPSGPGDLRVNVWTGNRATLLVSMPLRVR